MAHIKTHFLKLPYICKQSGCEETFFDYLTLNIHIRKKHDLNVDNIINEEICVVSNLPLSSSCLTNAINYIPSENNDKKMNEDSYEIQDETILENLTAKLKKKAFLMTMGFKSRSRISETVLNEFLCEFDDFIKEILHIVVETAVKTFKEDRNSENNIKFSSQIKSFNQPFAFINSKFKQEKELKKTGTELNLVFRSSNYFDLFYKGMFISPQTIYLSKRLDTVMKNNESIQVMKDICIEYVSIKETVQILLENEKIKHAIDQSSMVIDKFDKQYYTEHELFKNKKNLKILLYYDGLQMTNALGDTNGVNKCAMFYFAIENLTRKHNSCLKNIFLIAIMFDQDIKLYGFEKILSLIMTDICFLEIHGIQIKSEVYRSSIAQFVADNLGIHEVFHLKCCFRGENICHLCDASTTKIQTLHSFELFEQYTREKYENDVKIGKYKPCLLNTSKYFHITDNYAFDITHDLWQGVVTLELSLLFMHLISIKAFDLDFLNLIIKSFSYKNSERKNKPSPILITGNKIRVRQKAAKMACLFRILPFIIGEKIDKKDENWELYLILSRIIDIIHTRNNSIGVTYQLEIMIREHHEKFKLLYPDVTLKPKHHNMIHYGEAIRRLGNLVDYSSIRFEAKHSFFKTSFETSNNTINVPKNLSNKHQTMFAYNLIQDDQLNTKLILLKAETIKFSQLKNNRKLVLSKIESICDQDTLDISSVFEYYGYVYKSGMVFIHNEEDVNFCKLNFIVRFKSKHYVIASVLETNYFNEHFHAFEVKSNDKEVIIDIDQMPDFYPVSIYKSLDVSNNCDFIRPQSFII
jgi:hypothetical protein